MEIRLGIRAQPVYEYLLNNQGVEVNFNKIAEDLGIDSNFVNSGCHELLGYPELHVHKVRRGVFILDSSRPNQEYKKAERKMKAISVPSVNSGNNGRMPIGTLVEIIGYTTAGSHIVRGDDGVIWIMKSMQE